MTKFVYNSRVEARAAGRLATRTLSKGWKVTVAAGVLIKGESTFRCFRLHLNKQIGDDTVNLTPDTNGWMCSYYGSLGSGAIYARKLGKNAQEAVADVYKQIAKITEAAIAVVSELDKDRKAPKNGRPRKIRKLLRPHRR